MSGAPPGPAAPRRRILFVTGTRADYGKLKSIIRAVDEAPEFDYAIFATGMHLLAKYGRTWKEIETDGFSEIFLHFNQDHYTDFMMDRVLADTIRGLSHYVAEHAIDLIVVHGDRVEALAGALVGSLNGILVAHIEGGEAYFQYPPSPVTGSRPWPVPSSARSTGSSSPTLRAANSQGPSTS